MLLIDSREQPSMYVRQLQGLLAIEETQVLTLPAGDYLYCNHPTLSLEYSKDHLLVERKKMGDFVSSFLQHNKNGKRRLIDQLERCGQLAGQVVLLLEGVLKPALDPSWLIADGRARKFPYMAAQGLLLSLQTELGVRILWTETPVITQVLLVGLHSYWKKPLHGSWVQLTFPKLKSS